MYLNMTNLVARFIKACCFLLCLPAIPAIAQQTPHTIDVMVLYNSEAASNRNGAITTYINSLIASSNTTYEDSNMQVRIRLVHTQEININGVNAIDGNSLGQLRNNAQVNELRAQYGADLVALLTVAQRSSSGGTVCGIGYVGNGSNGQLSRFAKDAAFSITGVNCGATTFTHELGHNMGLGHSRRQGSTGGVFDFGVGYGVQNSFSTVMAYNQVFNARRIERFSNPLQSCVGLPCGINRNNADGADAVFSVNTVAAQLENYLPSKMDDGTNESDADPVRAIPEIPNNVVLNSSIESGLDEWSDRFGSQISHDSVRRFTGEHSVRVSNRSFFYSGVSQDLLGRLTNGETYTISAAMRLEGEGSDAGRMVIGINDERGTRYTYFDRIGVTGDQWNTIEGEFTLDTVGRVNNIFILFYGPAAERNFYVDQVSIASPNVSEPSQNDPVAPSNIIFNGDLEQANATHWETGFFGSIQLADETQRNGLYSLRSENRLRWYDGPMQRVTTRITQGNVYQLDAWVKMASQEEHNIEARLYFRDEAGHHWMRIDRQRVGADWVQLNGTVSVQATGDIEEARVHFFGPAAGNHFYIDDVILQEQ